MLTVQQLENTQIIRDRSHHQEFVVKIHSFQVQSRMSEHN